MDFKSLLQSMDAISETVHKGNYGNEYQPEQPRDEYGHKIPVAKKKDEPKKEVGGQSKADKFAGSTSGIQSMLGNKPSGKVGKVSAKRKLKDWIEVVETNKLNEADQVTIAPASSSTQVINQGDKTLGTVNNPQLASTIKSAIGQGQMTLNPDQEMAEDGSYSAKDARAGKDIGKPGKNFSKIAKDAGKRYGSKEAGQRVAGAILNKLRHPSESVEEAAVEESGLQAYLGNKKYGKDGMDALRKAGQAHASEKKMQNIRAKYSSKEDMAEAKDLPGKQDKLDVAEPKGKLDAKDFAALRAKKKVKESQIMQVVESINFKELMATADSDIQKMLIELQNDVELFKDTGHTSDLLDSFLKVHLHHNKNKMDEGSIEDHTQHGLDATPSKFVAVDPNPAPTSFKVDPIQATTDRVIGGAEKAGSFIKGLMAPKKNPFESKDMKDKQFESWENQLNTLLNEGLTVSSSTGQQGSPDSVSVTANDEDAQKLLSALRQAGIGVFGGEEHQGSPSAYGAPQHEEEPGHGTETPASPEVVGDGDDMMALIKKMTGIESGSSEHQPEGTATSDYEPEEDGEEVSEGHDSVKMVKDTARSVMKAHGISSVNDLSAEDIEHIGDNCQINYEEVCKILGCKLPAELGPVNADDEEVEEGNMFTGNLAKARAQGKKEADLDGDGDMEKVKEEHDHEEGETCNECGMYECDCGPEEQVEESYANSDDDKAFQDLQYMLQTLAGGLNKPKHGQATGNIQKVTMETTLMKDSSSLLTDWQKLSGIK